jgi:calcineurin-like phosphoesterase family protein
MVNLVTESKFISDLHLSHQSVLQYRGFSDIEEHDEYIVNNIINDCNSGDTLYLLGDICFLKDSIKYIRKIRESVSILKLIPGNHEFERSYAPTIYDYLDLDIRILGSHFIHNQILLSHSPIHPKILNNKYINVHGHTHGFIMEDHRYFDVSVEAIDFTPITSKNIMKNLGKQVMRILPNIGGSDV